MKKPSDKRAFEVKKLIKRDYLSNDIFLMSIKSLVIIL